MKPSRRQLLRASLVTAAAAASPLLLHQAKGEERAEGGDNISGFPVYNVRDFGAKPDGVTMNTQAIQSAIDLAGLNGGGVVYFPSGNYVAGTLSLRCNVTLYLEAGAVLWASKNRQDYSKGSFIHAENVQNAAISGRGTIDGNGISFWTRTKVPVHGQHWVADKWRPQALAIFVNCTKLLLEGVTFRNSPSWHIHPIDCDNLTIQGISILAGVYAEHGPNTDGIDPDGCSKVRISDCYIQTGDDSIVLKCTDRRSVSGRTRACRDVTVTNCVLLSGETALKIGSETYGQFRNITFSNCAILDAGCGIGLWMRDDGLIDGWVVDNIAMTLTAGGQPIYMTQYPRSQLSEHGAPHPDKERQLGTVRNVMISNVEATGCGSIFIQGMEEKHLAGITIENVRLQVHAGRDKAKALNVNPPYPFPVWGHRISPYGIYCRYVDSLKLRHVQLSWEAPEDPDWGCAIRCQSLNDVEIDGFIGRQSKGSGKPAIDLADTESVFIHNCRPPEGTGDFLRLGAGSQNVTLMSNNLHRAQQVAHVDSGVDPKELYMVSNRLPGRTPS